MKLFFVPFLLLVTSISHGQVLEKGKDAVVDAANAVGKASTKAANFVGKTTVNAANDLDSKVIHGGFPGVYIPWTCFVGQNESKAHLPKNMQVRMTMNRLGDIGFKPDIFKTNNNIGNFFKKIIGGNKVDNTVDYNPCVKQFIADLKASIEKYKKDSCEEGNTKNPACKNSVENIVTKAEKKAYSSPFLKKEVILTTPEKEIKKDTVVVVPPVTPPEKIEEKIEDKLPEEPADETEIVLDPPPAKKSVKANNQYLQIFGGGGEPAGDSTIFDRFIGDVAPFSKKSNWSTSVSFNGGHSKTEAIMSSGFPQVKAIKDFSPNSYEDQIKDYEKKILSGEIKSGDQIMMLINSHGSEATPGVLTHTIAAGGTVENLNTLKGTTSVSLDRLKALIALAESKGIKMAVADMSCHAGLTQELATPKTCVISASGPRHYSYGGAGEVFSNRFVSNLKQGSNLEDIFLKARSESTDPAFPMISGDVAKSIQDKLYPMLTKYIYSDLAKGKKFTPDITASFESGSCWSEDANLDKLMDFSKEIETIVDGDFTKFRKALQNYADYRKSIFEDLKKMGADALKTDVKVCSSNKTVMPTANGCTSFKASMVMTMDIDGIIQKRKDAPTGSKKNDEDFISYWQDLAEQKAALFKANPGLVGYADYFSKLENDYNKSYLLAHEVAAESKKLYDSLYRSELQTDKTPSACRNFVL